MTFFKEKSNENFDSHRLTPNFPSLSCIMSIAFVRIRNFSLKPFLEKMVKNLNFNLEVAEEGNVCLSKKGFHQENEIFEGLFHF